MQQVHISQPAVDSSAAILIAEHVRRLLETMGLGDAQVLCASPEESTLCISVIAENTGSMLIGAQGAHLYALQHIIRCVLRKNLHPETRILLDVNGYRARRERGLVSLAEETARKAQKTGTAIELEPMNATDRRAVHTALSSHKEVRTESLGEGLARRVIVLPVFL
jgi:spoIIIJ-associated protein